MANQGKRKFPALDIVNLMATLTMEKWRFFLERAAVTGSIEKLISYRYGLQAGMSDAVSKGLANEKMDLWVMKRIRDVEKCMKYIVKKKHPMPGDVVSKTHKGKRIDYVQEALMAKRKRDQEFSNFLMKSAF